MQDGYRITTTTMNGTVISRTPIAVDFWKIRECPTAKIFFLTHLHGDHVVGLSSSWQRVIHCSPLTGELLVHLYGIEQSLIRPLEVGASHIIDLDDIGSEKMSVTVIDANHCPGSVMFLFEGYFGRILHTGDFRYHCEMFDDQNENFLCDIDRLYLDNTYCSPQCTFPSRESALNKMVDLINSHPQCSVVIGMRNLGKEDMLANIALKCKEWISIPGPMLKRINLLNLPNVFCVDDESCRIRVVKFNAVSKKNIEIWNSQTPTIAILPTALYQGIGFQNFGNTENIYTVQYSDHSSYPEIAEFVSRVNPKKIIPIVGVKARGPFGIDISDRANMSRFSHLLKSGGSQDTGYDIPVSVQRWMFNVSSVHSNKREGKRVTSGVVGRTKNTKLYVRGVVFSDSDGEDGKQVNRSSEEVSVSLKNNDASLKDTNTSSSDTDILPTNNTNSVRPTSNSDTRRTNTDIPRTNTDTPWTNTDTPRTNSGRPTSNTDTPQTNTDMFQQNTEKQSRKRKRGITEVLDSGINRESQSSQLQYSSVGSKVTLLDKWLSTTSRTKFKAYPVKKSVSAPTMRTRPKEAVSDTWKLKNIRSDEINTEHDDLEGDSIVAGLSNRSSELCTTKDRQEDVIVIEDSDSNLSDSSSPTDNETVICIPSSSSPAKQINSGCSAATETACDRSPSLTDCCFSQKSDSSEGSDSPKLVSFDEAPRQHLFARDRSREASCSWKDNTGRGMLDISGCPGDAVPVTTPCDKYVQGKTLGSDSVEKPVQKFSVKPVRRGNPCKRKPISIFGQGRVLSVMPVNAQSETTGKSLYSNNL